LELKVGSARGENLVKIYLAEATSLPPKCPRLSKGHQKVGVVGSNKTHHEDFNIGECKKASGDEVEPLVLINTQSTLKYS